ncbi:hypothetical protein P7C70_g3256, partial [Phenoliferia sp. Uapishka_3]
MSTRASTSRACKRAAPVSDVETNSESELSELSGSEEGGGSGSESDATARVGKEKGKQVARPPTKKIKQAPISDDDDEPAEESGSESDSDEEYGKKKSSTRKNKKAAGKARGKRGGLEGFTLMPLDLFYEVCSHLNCTDLLRLSLSSRPVRELLLSPSSSNVWVSARRASGLPDLTSDNMNEIEYAHLVFWTKCQTCNRANVPYADYFLRTRLCKPCRKLASIITKAEPVDDAIWERIKPSVLRILEQEKTARLANEAKAASGVRQNRLRDAYDNLLESVATEDSKASFPLFGDFVHLPTIRPFWEAADVVFGQSEWTQALPMIAVDIENHRTTTRIHAIKMVLAATTNASMDELDDDPAAYSQANYPDSFFTFATSFLF